MMWNYARMSSTRRMHVRRASCCFLKGMKLPGTSPSLTSLSSAFHSVALEDNDSSKKTDEAALPRMLSSTNDDLGSESEHGCAVQEQTTSSANISSKKFSTFSRSTEPAQTLSSTLLAKQASIAPRWSHRPKITLESIPIHTIFDNEDEAAAAVARVSSDRSCESLLEENFGQHSIMSPNDESESISDLSTSSRECDNSYPIPQLNEYEIDDYGNEYTTYQMGATDVATTTDIGALLQPLAHATQEWSGENSELSILDSEVDESMQPPPQERKSKERRGEKKHNPPIRHPLVSKMIRGVNTADPERFLETFYKLSREYKAAKELELGEEEPFVVPTGLIRAAFRLCCPERPFDAYQVLDLYRRLPDTQEALMSKGSNGIKNDSFSAYAPLYERLCDTLRVLNPFQHNRRDSLVLVRSVAGILQRMDYQGQQTCLPTFLSSVAEQRFQAVGQQFGPPIYQYVFKQNMNIPEGWYVHMLAMSTYAKHGHVPYADLLHRAVGSSTTYLHPPIVLNVLENFFPFTDTQSTTSVLKSILALQKRAAAETESTVSPSKRRNPYELDIRMLEMVGSAAANQGQSDINLIIWDMMDLLGHAPTEMIYENTIMTFAQKTFTCREAFLVLAEMEKSGFKPSLALLRSVSVHLRHDSNILDFCFDQLYQLRREGTPISVSALNCLMSASAERGDVDRVLTLFDEFDKNELQPDVNSFSFAFESLGKNLRREHKAPQDHTDACNVAAESFLNRMDEMGLQPSHHVIRQYVEMLCLLGQVDTATAVVSEISSQGEFVNSKTVYRVAMANLKLNKFEVARNVASSANKGDSLKMLSNNIDREQEKFERDQLSADS